MKKSIFIILLAVFGILFTSCLTTAEKKAEENSSSITERNVITDGEKQKIISPILTKFNNSFFSDNHGNYKLFSPSIYGFGAYEKYFNFDTANDKLIINYGYKDFYDSTEKKYSAEIVEITGNTYKLDNDIKIEFIKNGEEIFTKSSKWFWQNSGFSFTPLEVYEEKFKPTDVFVTGNTEAWLAGHGSIDFKRSADIDERLDLENFSWMVTEDSLFINMKPFSDKFCMKSAELGIDTDGDDEDDLVIYMFVTNAMRGLKIRQGENYTNYDSEIYIFGSAGVKLPFNDEYLTSIAPGFRSDNKNIRIRGYFQEPITDGDTFYYKPLLKMNYINVFFE